jgi:D-3-phosphoglycerate dehydrogenase
LAKNVLVTSRSFGSMSDRPLQLLKENGFSITFKSKKGLYTEADFLNEIGNYDALIIGADPFSEKVMQKADGKLKIICKHGAGLDNFDLETAKKYHIRITNVPGTNSNAVADLALGLMLDVARRITFAAAQVKDGQWKQVTGTDVYKKTLGLIGFGAIGKCVARRALGFGMKVVVYDPYLQKLPEEFQMLTRDNFNSVIGQADFLSLHVPLTEQTKGLINKTVMQRMKKGSFIINTSRGGIVNESDLYDAIVSGQIGGAGLDVVEHEPPTGNPLLTLPQVVVVPHIAMYSSEAINAVSEVCAENIVRMFVGEEPKYIVV